MNLNEFNALPVGAAIKYEAAARGSRWTIFVRIRRRGSGAGGMWIAANTYGELYDDVEFYNILGRYSPLTGAEFSDYLFGRF